MNVVLLAQEDVAAFDLPNIEYSALLPQLTTIGAALLLLTTVSLIGRRLPSSFFTVFSVGTAVAVLGTIVFQWTKVQEADGPSSAVAGAVALDGFSCVMIGIIAVAVILGALISDDYLAHEPIDRAEFHVLMLLSAAGGMIMASANDLIVLFLGLEILSIALYVMAGMHARRTQSREAAMKYFVLGAFSSALFLYGIALVYGATGTTNLSGIAAFLAQNVLAESGTLLAGIALLLVGLGFKVAAVPFHAWTPDVYEGAPTPVTGFMAAAAKAAGFAGLLRVFLTAMEQQRLEWQPIVAVLAGLTLVVGAILAVAQSNVKRMLAYSSISHAGYVLIGLQVASADGLSSSIFYLLAYTFMILGSFGVVTAVARRGDAAHDLADYRGLGTRRPVLAAALTLFLLAQAGVPLTSGFLAKFGVIAAAVEEEAYVLAVIGMIAAAIAAFVYLRLIVAMYLSSASEGESADLELPVGVGMALVLSAVATVALGVLPDAALDIADRATFLF